MCGFLLIVDARGVREAEALGALETLVSRGPDDHGHALLPLDQAAGSIFLGHRRLSIIGLGPENRQPFRHGRVLLCFNGEIYNYVELREELRAEGAVFQLESSDVEVLAAGLELHGADFLARLNGMYAGACLFRDTGELLLFRDPTGQKPCYLHQTEDLLVVASEPKAISAYLGRGALEVDERKLLRGFLLGYHNEGTVHAGVDALPPGHYARLARPLDEVRPIAFSTKPGPGEGSLPLDGEGFSAVCARAVERHLRADVPVGLYLSGGIDSTLLLHHLTAIGVTPSCFTIGFRDALHDETPWAKRAAEHYGAPLRVETVDVPSFEETCAILDYFDEPFYDSSAIPTAVLNRIAAESVKVVLSGDGGDELFCGYRRYVHTLSVQSMRKKPLGEGLLTLARTLGPKRIRRSKFLENAPYSPIEALFRNSHDLSMLGYVDGDAEAVYDDALSSYARWFDDGRTLDPAIIFRGDIPNYLAGDILTKADRCSMMTSIEQRAPLLDAELVRFGLRLPANQKVAGGEGKALLKRLIADELGRDFAYRRKQGFAFPVRRLLVSHEGPIKETIAAGLAAGPVEAGHVGSLPLEGATDAELSHVWKLFVLARFQLAHGQVRTEA